MKLTTEQQEWIKIHQGVLRQIISERTQDYFNQVVDEPDPHRKEILSLLVKELRMAILTIDNLSSLKEKKKPVESYTGV